MKYLKLYETLSERKVNKLIEDIEYGLSDVFDHTVPHLDELNETTFRVLRDKLEWMDEDKWMGPIIDISGTLYVQPSVEIRLYGDRFINQGETMVCVFNDDDNSLLFQYLYSNVDGMILDIKEFIETGEFPG